MAVQCPVRPDELYSLAFVRESKGLKEHNLRMAGRQRLKVFYCGKDGWVRGDDRIACITGIGNRAAA